MSRGRSDLPFGSEFSPSQVDLPGLLQIADTHAGDIRALEAAILKKYFGAHSAKDADKADQNRRTLAMNCRLGLQGYGLIDDEGNLTSVGEDLLKLNGNALFSAFGRHILLSLNGMRVVQCVREMIEAGNDVTYEKLEDALRERGMKVAKISRHLPSMRLWLEKAGVFSGGRWQIDGPRLEEVLGTDPEDFPALANLSPPQRAFLRALANTGKGDAQSADGIRELAEAVYGVAQPRKGFAAQVLKPLQEAGWIEATKTTAGHGAKPYRVKPTSRVTAEIIVPLLDQLKGVVEAKLLALLRKPLAEILTELKSTNKYTAGLALEALAFKVMRLLDMTYVATRLRGTQTGGAEVDLIFESARLVFSRWQVQCKNVRSGVRVDDVAKEVGLTHVLKSGVIVIISTFAIGAEARKYARRVMRDSNLAIILVDGEDIVAIKDDLAKVVQVFRREAESAMRLKALSKEDVPLE